MSYLSKDKKPSFSSLYDYTDILKEKINRLRTEAVVGDDSFAKERILQDALLEYYQCLKRSTRLKTQTVYCKQALIDLFPSFCKGYFKL